MGIKDIEVLKIIKDYVQDDGICLGQNQFGLYYGEIVMWYLRKNIQFIPKCLENENTKVGIVFHPQLGEFYQKEFIGFLN